MTDARQVARLLLESGAVVVRPQEPFRFASGLLSPIYCDNRLLLSDVTRRNVVVEGFVGLAKKISPQVVAGTATAGIPWGAWVADQLEIPFAYVRGKAKGHGKGKRIEGKVGKGDRVVLIEDLISTGGSVLSAAEAIQEEGAEVAGVLGIFSYGFPASQKTFRNQAVSLQTITNLEHLLAEATATNLVDSSQRKLVEAWAADPENWTP